ncbi:MAG: ribosome biogenesis GTP-binding protein YsxC [Bacilli bacterium]|nr:ribosome biogenesis GTP-binding protein YsxC [Bacilli bacterium]
MINLQKTSFVKSSPTKKDFLIDKKQVVFLGKSNVGKSSLINALTNQKTLAVVSSTPGRTQMLNYFSLEDKYYLVDAPGYGYYKDSKLDFTPMMDDYSSLGNKIIKRAYILLDPRRKITVEDKVCINIFYNAGISIRPIFTKVDKLTQKEKAAAEKDFNQVLPNTKIFWVSALKKTGLDFLKADISQALE